MPAYLTTKPREDGPILSNSFGTRPLFASGRHFERLEGVDPSTPLKAGQKRNGPRRRRNRNCPQALIDGIHRGADELVAHVAPIGAGIVDRYAEAQHASCHLAG